MATRSIVRKKSTQSNSATENNVFFFEKRSRIRVQSSQQSTILTVRPSEGLEIIGCSGRGRLLLSVSETTQNQIVVESAICFDSEAYFFNKNEFVQLNHIVLQDANVVTLVELHVEAENDVIDVDIKQTFCFDGTERRDS